MKILSAMRFACTLLLVCLYSVCAQSQSLVFHLYGGSKSTISLPATFTVTASGDKLIIDGNGSVVELSKNDVMAVTYRDKKGDANGDTQVDVADIATIIDIMAGKDGDNGTTIHNIQTFTVENVSFNMVLVDGGTFQMGSNDSDAKNDKPVHQVTVSSFSIGQTEVTQELWEAVMGSNPSSYNGAKRPVERVSWNDCQTFISKLNKLTGRLFRLPTEAEWEFAARGGTKSKEYNYAGSNTIDDVAWYWDDIPSQTNGSEGYGTQPVATKQANELGIYDMSGNVLEWCQDWYDIYTSDAQTEPAGPSSGSDRVYRGGSWGSSAKYCRVTYRGFDAPSVTNGGLGLRLAM